MEYSDGGAGSRCCGGGRAIVSGSRSNMSCICIQRAFTVPLLLSFLYCTPAPAKGFPFTHVLSLMHTTMSCVCVRDDRLFNSYLFTWPDWFAWPGPCLSQQSLHNSQRIASKCARKVFQFVGDMSLCVAAVLRRQRTSHLFPLMSVAFSWLTFWGFLNLRRENETISKIKV